MKAALCRNKRFLAYLCPMKYLYVKPTPEPPVESPESGTVKPSLPYPVIKQFLGLLLLFVSFMIERHFLHSHGTTSFAVLYQLALNGKMSGRMGGNVMMANGRGRGFTKPRIVRNVFTAAVRYSFTNLSAGWRALSAANQALWIAFSYPKKNRFGVEHAAHGKQAYIGINTNLNSIAIAPIAAPATFTGVTGSPFNVCTFNHTGPVVNLSWVAGVAGTATVYSLVFATTKKGTGINQPGNSQFRIIGAYANSVFSLVGGTYVFDIHTQYVAKWGTIVAGSNYFVRVVQINSLTGQKLSPIQLMSLSV